MSDIMAEARREVERLKTSHAIECQQIMEERDAEIARLKARIKMQDELSPRNEYGTAIRQSDWEAYCDLRKRLEAEIARLREERDSLRALLGEAKHWLVTWALEGCDCMMDGGVHHCGLPKLRAFLAKLDGEG